MAASSIDLSRLRNPVLKDILGDVLDTATGHDHDGTNSKEVAATTAAIDDNAVTTAKILNLNVTEGKIAAGAVTETKLGAGAVTEAKIGAGAVTGTKIAADTITSTNIAANAITSSELADDAVDTAAIANSAVTAAKIADGVVANAEIAADAAIAWSKLAALADAHILVGSAGNVATDVAVTGDIAITNAGVTSIAAGAIVNADVNAAAAIAFSKLAALPSGQILVGSAGNAAAAVAMSGDIAITNAGVTSIGSDKVTNAMCKANTKRRSMTSESISLTNSGVATTSKLLLMPSSAITITLARLVYDNASNGGTVPNVEVGVDGTLAAVVAAEAAELNKAAWYYKDLTIVSGAVAANKAVILSTVAAGATTNTGSVRLYIEYTVDDAA